MRARRPIREFCECGSGITLVGDDDQADLRLLENWRGVHDGPGHEERVSAGEARAVRHQYVRRP